ncbi:DapH/DapD/GlmU-related protein [Stackebrandtia soli]|uniref:DapH/DapD/GlmU-related protein n=1 Tax=Stackebrandtia soli TaxID=1892856 RepID=UPI0039E939D3
MSSYVTDSAWGTGAASYSSDGALLDVWFERFGLGAPSAVEADVSVSRCDIRDVETRPIQVAIDSLANDPVDAGDVYLRLHLLSGRHIRPHQASLVGIFGLLSNNAWTDLGPTRADRIEEARAMARRKGHMLRVDSVDKFPRMTDYIVPTGVRIADASRVRLGAHLASGTTVMHEGFVNYNAGTLGNSMVEGRIAAGVVVGDGSDVGGGSSIMGTLSGGGKEIVSIGKRCLLGANAGLGISLGDDCVVAAGCYVTAGSKVTLPSGEIVKAAELSGADNMMFWTNTVTGTLEVKPRNAVWGSLNEALHQN